MTGSLKQLLTGSLLVGALAVSAGPARADVEIDLDDVARPAGESAAREEATRERQVATYRQAVTLSRLGFPHAAFSLLSSIADQPKHAMYEPALDELAKIVAELPDESDSAERLTRFDAGSVLRRLGSVANRPLLWRVSFKMARFLHRAGRHRDALVHLNRVAPQSPDFAAARYLAALCHVKLHSSREAVLALHQVEHAPLGTGPRGAALRDLARLALGRIHYSSAFRPIARGELAVDARNLEAALEHLGRVDLDSPHAQQALLEQAWAWFVAGSTERALGNLRTLSAPRFAKGLVPEAEVLRAAIHWEGCDPAGAAYLLRQHRVRLASVLRELETLQRRFAGDYMDESFWRFAASVRGGRAELGRDAGSVLGAALVTRELDRHTAYLALVDAEIQRFRRSAPAFRSSSLGQQVEDVLKLSRDLAVRNAGAVALAHLDERIAMIRNALRRSERLLENKALASVRARAPSSETVSVAVYDGEEHVLWPFDGEYWDDELGSYRERVRPTCGAGRAEWAPR